MEIRAISLTIRDYMLDKTRIRHIEFFDMIRLINVLKVDFTMLRMIDAVAETLFYNGKR